MKKNFKFYLMQSVFMSSIIILVGAVLVGTASISLAQGGTWTKLKDMPTARYFVKSCVLDGKIYVIGGSPHPGQWTGSYAVGTVEVYDPALDSWDTTKTDMPTKRIGHCICAVNDKIYAMGGSSVHGADPIGTVEEYDPVTDSWDNAKDPMPSPLYSPAYGVIDNKIYVAGGSEVSYTPSSTKLEIYDPATDTWDITKSPMPIAISASGSVVLNDKFYVIGGLLGSPWTLQRTVYMYDPATDNWSRMADLQKGRVSPGAVVLDEKIYAIGGTDGTSTANGVERYDPDLNKWAVIDTIPTKMVYHCANVFNNKIYIFGGSKTYISSGLTPTHAVYSYYPYTSSVESKKNIIPEHFMLSQNYPNPFNPSTTIHYSIPEQSHVTIKVFDVRGRELATLVNGQQPKGNFEIEFDATELTSGVYFYKIQTGDFVDTKKMILLR